MTQTAPRRQHRQRWQARRAAARAAGWHGRPIAALFLLLAAAGCGNRDNKTAMLAPRSKLSVTTLAPSGAGEDDGAGKLRLAAQLLEEHPLPLSAKVRQTVNVMGHEMRGTGDYYQMPYAGEGALASMLSRMDLRVQIHDRTAMWKQVCDGKFIWTESRVPDEEKTLARADGEPGYSTRLDRVDLAEALEKQGLVRDSDAPPAGAVSGLPQLLRTLAGVFDFAPPRSILMRSPDGKWVDVWLLEGQWDPGVLGELLPEQGRAIKLGAIDLGLLPPRMPDRVKVYLGQKRSGPWLGALTSDRPPPPDLFPFRIEYGRQDAETDEVAQVLNLEVYDVVFDDDKLRPDKFTFKSSRKHRNATSRFVRALQRSVRAAK